MTGKIEKTNNDKQADRLRSKVRGKTEKTNNDKSADRLRSKISDNRENREDKYCH